MYFELHVTILNCRNLIVKVDTKDSIQEVKAKIQVKLGIPPHAQQLVCGGKLLENEKILGDYGLMTEPISLKCGIVKFATFCGEHNDLIFGLSEGIEEVKKRIEKLECLPRHRQIFLFAGNELDDQNKVKISEVSSKQCTIIDCALKGSIHIFVEMDIPTHHSRMCLQVIPEMKILHIKRSIEQQSHVPVYLQTLLSGEIKLENSKCLMDYNVNEQSTLQLVIEQQSYVTKLSLIVRSTWGTKEEVELSLENIDNLLVISSLQKEVPFACPPNRVFFGSVELKNNSKHMITHKSTLFVTSPECIPIVVRMPLRLEPQLIGVKPGDTIASMKSKVTRVTPGNQMFMGSVHLLESQTLNHYGIAAASEVLLTDPGTVPLFIRTRFREEYICCKPTGTVRDLKSIISKVLGIPERHQRLIYNQSLIFVETKTLTSYAIGPGSTILVAVTPNEMDIHVTMPSKKVTTLICSQDDKIEDIKLKVEQKEGIPVEHQALLFEDDKMTLREANITPGLHIQVFYGNDFQY